MSSVAQCAGAKRTKAVILVVEDEFLLRLNTAEALRDAGYQVVEAANADTALSILATLDFDLVFTDVQMPGSIDGIQLRDHVAVSRPGTKVLLTSGFSTKIMARPMDDFICKPYELGKLVETVERILGSSRHEAD